MYKRIRHQKTTTNSIKKSTKLRLANLNQKITKQRKKRSREILQVQREKLPQKRKKVIQSQIRRTFRKTKFQMKISQILKKKNLGLIKSQLKWVQMSIIANWINMEKNQESRKWTWNLKKKSNNLTRNRQLKMISILMEKLTIPTLNSQTARVIRGLLNLLLEMKVQNLRLKVLKISRKNLTKK